MIGLAYLKLLNLPPVNHNHEKGISVYKASHKFCFELFVCLTLGLFNLVLFKVLMNWF